ncbi:hypothetical protein FACS1894211_07380 [Clostridia bacterium]|nr:hypothetical protein FACS1894211_07380 [Clostridia bacterium]
MSDVLISIITVSFNSAATIAETIESVLNQTYPNMEYIIVDGQSGDDTVSIAQGYAAQFAEKGCRFEIVSEPDKGIYDAMNKGIGRASGEITGIINSDDYYMPDALEKVAAFYQRTDFDVMYGDLRIFGSGKEYIKKSKHTKRFNTRFWNHPTTFVKRTVYAVQQYAVDSIYDDLDFMLRVRRAGYKVCILNEVLANFRLGGVSNKKSLRKMLKRVKIRNRIYKRNGYKVYRLNNFIIEAAKYVLSK